jgi:hypothetical protein
MAISTHFQDEINRVDAAKTLTYIVDTATYTLFEWSYSSLTITGGSDLACEYGASALLDEMGFRWYAPDTGASGNQGRFTKRPMTISITLAQAKTTFWMPTNNIFLTYGHSWANQQLADRTTLNDALAKWQILNSMRTAAWPAGHRWPNIINNNQAYFQANPTMYTGTLGTSGVGLNLSVTGQTYTDMVEICAAEILRQGLNTWNRTNMDATDGNGQSSDLFYPFTLAVAAKVRSGTSAIGTHPMRAGVATAALGAYAYAGHRQAPTLAYTPGVYTQIALGFTPQDTWVPLIEAHGPKSDAILLREYWAVNDQYPLSNSRRKTHYFETFYPDMQTAGAIGFTAESSAYWLANMVMFRQGIQFAKTGDYSYAQALDDVMEDVFDDDSAVREIYEFWSDPQKDHSEYGLRKSFDIIDTMQDGWYKDFFMYYHVILAKFEYLPDQTLLAEQTPDDPFPAAFADLMSDVVGIRLYDIFHSYGFLRQKANGAVAVNYPALRMFASPLPDWINNPTLPTWAEFDAYHAILLGRTPHDAYLDSEDLALVRGITPRIAATAAATKFCNVGRATYWFLGPGTVKVEFTTSTGTLTGEFEETAYSTGVHPVLVEDITHVSNTGGFLFLDTFPAVRKDPDGTGRNHWLYIPAREAGSVVMRADPRVRFVDQNGEFDLLDEDAVGFVDPSNLGPGQIAINNTNTRGVLFNLNCNRYMSMEPTIALMPLSLAEEEFTSYMRVRIV